MMHLKPLQSRATLPQFSLTAQAPENPTQLAHLSPHQPASLPSGNQSIQTTLDPFSQLRPCIRSFASCRGSLKPEDTGACFIMGPPMAPLDPNDVNTHNNKEADYMCIMVCIPYGNKIEHIHLPPQRRIFGFYFRLWHLRRHAGMALPGSSWLVPTYLGDTAACTSLLHSRLFTSHSAEPCTLVATFHLSLSAHEPLSMHPMSSHLCCHSSERFVPANFVCCCFFSPLFSLEYPSPHGPASKKRHATVNRPWTNVLHSA